MTLVFFIDYFSALADSVLLFGGEREIRNNIHIFIRVLQRKHTIDGLNDAKKDKQRLYGIFSLPDTLKTIVLMAFKERRNYTFFFII